MKNKKKKILCTLLACSLLLLLTACGSEKNTNNQSGESSESNESQQNTNAPSSENIIENTENLSMENSELYLVSAGGGIVAVAFQGPENIEACFTDNSTDEPRTELILGHTYLGNGWTIYMTRMQDQETVDDPINVDDWGIIVNDKYDDSNYKVFSNLGRQLTHEELKDIGLILFGEHFGIIGGGTSYSGNCFTLETNITWLDTDYASQYWKHNIDESELSGLTERMTFFADDGTPISDYFSNYTMEVTLSSYDSVWLNFHTDLTKEQNKQMISELKGSHPYVIYAYDDGTTQQFQLLED